MLYTTPKMKRLYGEIQKRVFYMIPEKWDKIYLFASIEEGMNKIETGEMYFYYFPKGILKKDPINVYEIPNKFNIEETQYYKLVDSLYELIKRLKKEFISVNKKNWTNVIISVENFQFKVEYGFENLKESPYNSYDRHIIFRYVYLNTSINTYNKKERKIIEDYIKYVETAQLSKKAVYVEPVYKIEQKNVIDYQRENKDRSEKEVSNEDEIINFNYEMKNDYKRKIVKKEPKHAMKEKKKKQTNIDIDKIVKKQVEETIKETKNEYKNQILNFNKWE